MLDRTSGCRVWDAPQEVPEARLGDNFIGREDAHAVNLGVGLTLSGEMATDDLVFLERHLEDAQSVNGSSALAGSHPAHFARNLAPSTAWKYPEAYRQHNLTHF
jgi:hypothetical protein